MTLTKAIRDKSKIEEFLREVATKAGLDLDQVRAQRTGSLPRPTRVVSAMPAASSACTGAASGAQSLSIVVSNSSPARVAMMAMPWRPRSSR